MMKARMRRDTFSIEDANMKSDQFMRHSIGAYMRTAPLELSASGYDDKTT